MRIFLYAFISPLFLLISFSGLSSVTPCDASAVFDLAWESRFQRTSGWTGGDGVQSVDLMDGRILFLFGDTWIGKIENSRRGKNDHLVRNSIAVFHNPPGKTGSISFHWGNKGLPARPRAWIDPPGTQNRIPSKTPKADDAQTEWLWPLGDGVVIPSGASDRKLVLFFEKMCFDDRQKPPWNFRTAGSVLVVIEHAEEEIHKWKPVVVPIPFVSQTTKHSNGNRTASLSWGMALLPEIGERNAPSILYIYGIRQFPGSSNDLVLAKAPLSTPEDFGQWRFWTADGWKASPDDLQAIDTEMTNEFSVDPLPDPRSGLVLIQSDPFFQNDIWMRKADRPQGPFSPPIVVFSASSLAGCNGCFAYAAKSHRILSEPHGWMISFVVNSTDFDELLTNTDIYRPRFIRLNLEQVLP